MSYLQEQNTSKPERGDTVQAVGFPGRRVTLSRTDRSGTTRLVTRQRGFTLIELVITVTVMSILTLGIVPLMKLSVKRQKEEQLRAALRQMRTAIDEFHRDTVDMNCTGGPPPPNPYLDPRSKVKISDCTIFGVDNIDRYPPDLETLVGGVNVVPRMTGPPTGAQLSTKKKVYLRGIPIDPMTGESEWEFRSCYDAADSGSFGGENVFDVRSKSKEKALNGEKYSDW